MYLCSLHSNSAVDVDVKSRLVKDVLNLAGFMLPHREDVVPGPQPPTDWRYISLDLTIMMTTMMIT